MTDLTLLWQTIHRTLLLDHRVYHTVDTNGTGLAIAMGVAFIGGISLLLGQSVILFANRVRPPRFLASLLLNGVLYLGGLIVWAWAVRVAGWSLVGVRMPMRDLTTIMFLTAAPMIFGILILAPYLGPLIYRLLNVWSFLIAYQIVAVEYATGWWRTILIVGAGWLLTVIVNHTIGWPVIALTGRFRNWVAGANLNDSIADLIAKYSDHLLPNPDEIDELGLALHARAKVCAIESRDASRPKLG